MAILIGIDFEYNQPNEPHMGLMAVSICEVDQDPKAVWLYNDQQKKTAFSQWLLDRKDSHIFVSHNAVAEAQCFLALGLNPRDFKWVDTMSEYKQAANGFNGLQYGWYWQAGWRKSQPIWSSSELWEADELFGEERERENEGRKRKQKAQGISAMPVTPSLLNACKNVLGVDIGAGQKSDALSLILERKDEYSAEERRQILTYAMGDTAYLIPMWLKLQDVQAKRGKNTMAAVEHLALFRGRYSANVAIYSRNGIPIDLGRWSNLIANKPTAIDEAVDHFQSHVAPIYEYDHKEQRYKSTPNQEMAEPWIKSLESKLKITWPKNHKGYSFSSSEGSPIEEYRAYNAELEEFYQLGKMNKGLGYHATPSEAIERRAKGKKTFSDHLCSQSYLHPWYAPYGTQTGRNAPTATGFIFAQAGWLRGLINPPKGECIVEMDYGSQEAWIAAVLSKDEALIRAYLSGDPYLAFAIDAGAAPRSATKKSHGEVRNLFKSTVLGLQYGMGANKLSLKLTSDTKKAVSVAEAKELINLHKEVYAAYYEWKDRVWERYRDEGRPLKLYDGWYLDTHNVSKMSVLNFPVQGAGSAMMRFAIDEIIGKGVRMICPVHDSFVFQCKDSELESHCAIVKQAMLNASLKVLGRGGMRVGEPDILRHGEYWRTEKNAKTLERFSKFFDDPKENEEKRNFFDFLVTYA